ncbi:MAG TPA: sulfatase-like hydrolase/transferase [Algoriphagus sp.]|nr:sulfatase-like hydrolase/transferase [Algoriphagus sp.]
MTLKFLDSKTILSLFSICFLFAFGIPNSLSQTHKTENIVLITLDGMRWQEVFKGADSLLVDDTGMVKEPGSLLADFWHPSQLERRKMLLPFVWSTLVPQGQLYGNRAYGNLVNNSNTMWFSYPGYNEILTGKADDERINHNRKVNNPNVTFLEYLNQMPAYQGKVMAFAGWDAFPFIINEERSKVPVNAGRENVTGADLTEGEILLNQLLGEIRGKSNSGRFDAFTHHFAMEALKKHKPKALYISYGETDSWAHSGNYDQYLFSARQTDKFIQEIWETLQADPQYKDKTTLIITTDHGRGTGKVTWKDHGDEYADAGQVWMMAIGPDTPGTGEMKIQGQWYSSMIARTIFSLLEIEYPDATAGPVIQEMIR